jgi:hypothetical protein
MRCKSITQKGKRCKIDAVVNGHCVIHYWHSLGKLSTKRKKKKKERLIKTEVNKYGEYVF